VGWVNPLKRNSFKPNILDVLILLVVSGMITALFFKIHTVMDYQWNWSVISEYLFRYDPEHGWVPNMLVQGFMMTIRLSIWATILAVILGTGMGLCKVSEHLYRRLISNTYVEMVRNIPPLVLVFIFYFFIGNQIMTALGVGDMVRSLSPASRYWIGFFFAPASQFPEFISAVITLGIYEGAYITEIIRSGIESVDKEQWEASYALGLSKYQQMLYVIMPQAVRRILPSLAGQFISTIKDSSIVSVISIQELTFQGMELMAATYLTFEVWITITVMYFILTFCCSLLVGQIEIYYRVHLDK
jgi:polar amino acid transport system permease protein